MKNKGRWLGCIVLATIISFSVQTDASAQSFEDVSPTNPYWQMIQAMQEKGLISGYPEGTFRPNEHISRKHVAQLLNNALQLEAKTGTKIRYKDVPKNHPYYDAILTVSQAGIFSGDKNENFNPDAPITRIQLAKVLDLAFNLKIDSFSYFLDVNRSHWGYPHVQALYSNGITTTDQGNFKPNQPVTRAHHAAFLYRALNMPVLPSPDSKTLLMKEGIIDLVYRLPITVEISLIDHKSQASQFKVARADLLKNATQHFTDEKLKKYYDTMCMNCDMNLFPLLLDETDYRFEILENTENLVRIRTVSFAAPLKDAGYVEYAFEKQTGKWKLSGYDFQFLREESFDLTKEEAVQIAKNNYRLFESNTADVTFLDTKYEYVNDWYTQQDYRRLVYRMQVDTEERTFNIVFYLHNGSFFDQE